MRGVRSDDLPALAVMMTLLPRLALALTGPHVCHQVENYTVTSPEHYVEPVEIHTFTWCLHIPPRCLQTRTELRDSWRMKTETKFKSVQVCCEGYAVQEAVQGGKGAEATCAPRCQRCLGGTCAAPNECNCRPGFQGRDCSYECPSGTWGDSCKNKCECLRGDGCDPASGECNCPAGWTGSRCESPRPRCDQEAGVCVGGGESEIDPYEASGTSANLVPATVGRRADADYVEVVDFDREASLMARVTEQDSETPAVPSLPDELIPVRVDDGGPSTAISPARPAVETQSAEPSEEAPSSRLVPTRPTVRAAAAPAGGRLPQPDGPQRSSSFDFDEGEANFRVIVSPKTDYVKTTRKGGHGSAMSAITIDVAAMIVVGALVSIGLTSVAVLMIFHVRSRLLKAALSIYGHHQGKAERRYGEKEEASHQSPGKGLDVNVGTLPRGTMTRVNPIYDAGSELGSAVLTMDERPAEYANGTVTIGIRLSSNIRDLLESHYDRPASCSHRSGGGGGATAPMASAETDVEHVYDEIPLAAPFYFAKST